MAEIMIRVSDNMLKTAAAIPISLCLAGAGLFVWKSQLLVPAYRLDTYLSESGGLATGASVRLNGMPVGSVDAVNPAPAPTTPSRMVQAVLKIQKRYQNNIRSDSTASLSMDGLLGNRFVEIHGGPVGNPIPPGGEIIGMPTREVSAKDLIDVRWIAGKSQWMLRR